METPSPRLESVVPPSGVSTRHFDSVPPSDARTVFRLPSFATAAALGAAAHDAWRVFVEQSKGWGKAELVLWSYGLYAPAARWSPRAAEDTTALESLFRGLDERFAERVIKATRATILGVLASFSGYGAAMAFATRMRDEGAVIHCIDANGESMWCPTPDAHSLADRVCSLLAADVLNRPEAFADGAICISCGGITVGYEACCAERDRDQAAATTSDVGFSRVG